ncbi:hypothetical protein ABZT03_28765 [Streptomyces sp. NPDC005574]|uniref:hypothetical protein n=1 Tax=Streptomyces sp. NPDC005574 TaxID=3156891 RepID=UPI0033A5C2C3
MIAGQILMQAPKSDLSATRIEDAACSVLPAANFKGEARLIVADGSSGSAGSGWWASQLARDLCAAPGRAFRDSQAFMHVTMDAGLRWPDQRRTLLDMTASSGPMAWLAQHRISNSPAATLLGLQLLPEPAEHEPPDCLGGSGWRVVCVGDSCMFQVRAGCVVASVAVMTRVPEVIRAGGAQSSTNPRFVEGHWCSEDVFYLMTDALAVWWMRHADGGGRPWEVLDAVCATQVDFVTWVRDQRVRRALKDDDITLLRAECGT